MIVRDKTHEHGKSSRRTFLLLTPLAGIGGIIASFSAAAFRFLRPVNIRTKDDWIDVIATTETSGNKPIAKKVVIEEIAGWSRSPIEYPVYVLPGSQVVSAVCPHEGCELSWQDDRNVFTCPCHDSSFAANGARIYGPARRDMDRLPSRIQNGVLQVQVQQLTDTAQNLRNGDNELINAQDA